MLSQKFALFIRKFDLIKIILTLNKILNKRQVFLRFFYLFNMAN